MICPPYDIISAEQRARLAARDPRNAVHVELPASASDTPPGEAAYRAAGELFARWQGDGTLRREERPLIYVYEQRYRLDDGSAGRCRGFFCGLRLEQPGRDAGVRPHEHTLAAPKEDRYRLLRAVRANLSPVLLLYQHAAGDVPPAQLLDRLTDRPAEREATADDGIVHRLWTADPALSAEAAQLLAAAASGPLTIADGHHRYQTALRFRDETAVASRAEDAAADFVLALLYEAASGGLRIAPTHRLISGVGDTESLFAALGELLAVEHHARPANVLNAIRNGGIGIWTRHGGARLAVPGERGRATLSAGERELDVSVLARALPRLLGVTTDELERRGVLWYTRAADEAVHSVDDGTADAAFLLNPTPIESVLSHAARGEVMPPKSTYFEPKAATGLVFNPLSD